MELKINPAQKIIINFENVDYDCTRPKIGAVADMEKAVSQATEKGYGGVQLMVNFIVKCGLPEKVVRELDETQLEQVMAILTPSKKKR